MFYGKDIKKNHIYNSLCLFFAIFNKWLSFIHYLYVSVLIAFTTSLHKKNKRIFIRLFRQEFLESSSDSLRNRYRQM